MIRKFLANVLIRGASLVSAERVVQERRARINPIRGLNAKRMATAIDMFDSGYLREFAQICNKLAQRDDTIISVRGKRIRDVSEKGFEIVQLEESAAAEDHKAFLEDIYNNITATSVLNPDEQRGFSLLVSQMMDAIGMRWSVHELLWQPVGSDLRVTANWVPLWYFENIDGPLRYLPSLGASRGEELEETAWMITCGDGLMEATAIAYLFKMMPLKDWLAFSEKFGLPLVLGKSGATPGSDEWDAMVQAVRDIGSDWGGVVSQGSEIELVESKNAGNTPFQPLVDMMDRKISTIWRGGDLSTMSKGEAVGAEMQDEEKDILLKADAGLIAETLNMAIGRPAIDYRFGTQPLAYLKIKVPDRVNVDQEIKISNHLISHGAPVAISDEMERFGRTLPEDGEPLMRQLSPGPDAGNPDDEKEGKADLSNDGVGTPEYNRRLLRFRERVLASYAEDLRPLRDELTRIANIDDPTLRRIALRDLRQQLPAHLKRMAKNPQAVEQLAGMMTAEFFNGLEQAPTEDPT